MGEWSNLTQREKSNIIRFAIKNGVSDIQTIRDTFNVYAKDSLANVDYNMAAAKASGFGSNGNGHYPDTFKKPNHPTFSDESIYHLEATPGGKWRGNTYEPSDFVLNQQGSWNQFLRGFYGQEQGTGAVPVFNGGLMLPEVTVTPQYKEGGSIHIKHPGRLTALKKRTGKTEAELWATGNAHTRKMITFARNARKWHKHEDGGSNWLPEFTYNPSIQSDNGRQLIQSVLQDENIQRAVQQKALQRQAEIEAQRKAVSEIYNGMPNPGAGYVSGTDPLLQAVVDMTPAGDAEMATEAASELKNGNLKEAGLLGAALLLPNIFNKGIKKWRAAKNLSKVTDKTPIDPTQRIELLLNNYLDEKRLAHRNASTESLKDWAESIQLGGDSKAMYDMLVNSGVDVSKLKSTDLHYLTRIRQQQLATQMPTRYINNNTYDKNNPIMHLYEPNNTQPIGKLEYGYINGQHKGFNYEYGLEPAMIENLSNGTAKGVSRDLYDAAIKVAQDNGYPGVISGKLLLSPEATTHIWDLYYPDRRLLSMRGTHKYKTGDLSGQPIVMLEKPSKEVLPTKSFVFSPDIVDENGIMHIIPNGDIYHSTGGHLYPFSFQKNPYWKTPIVRY